MRKFLISVMPILSMSASVFAMDIKLNCMKINLPQSIVNNITILNSNSISILTPNHLLIYTTNPLTSTSANKYISFSAIPHLYPKSGEYFLNTWRTNLMNKNSDIIFSEIIPEKNGVLSILKADKGHYYIWCNFISNNYCYSITCSSNSNFDDTKELGMKLFNTVSYWQLFGE